MPLKKVKVTLELEISCNKDLIEEDKERVRRLVRKELGGTHIFRAEYGDQAVVTLTKESEILIRDCYNRDIHTTEDFKRGVATYYGLSVADLESKSRKRPIVIARGVAMYLANKYTTDSLSEIGRCFGGKNHTTVSNAIESTKYYMEAIPLLKMSIKKLLVEYNL